MSERNGNFVKVATPRSSGIVLMPASSGVKLYPQVITGEGSV